MNVPTRPVSLRALLRFAAPALLIVVGTVYVLTRDRDQLQQYELPTLAAVDAAAVQQVQMTQGDASLTLSRSADGWTIEPAGLAADGAQVDRIVHAAANLELTDLIAERPTYARYELDAGRALTVTLLRGGDVLRRFNVGKRAATFSHTFVTVGDDQRVFQARDDLTSVFATDGESLRDMNVLAFDATAISEIDATAAAQTLHLTRQLGAGADGVDWTGADGQSFELERVDAALVSLAALRANRFAETEPDGVPLLTLELRDPAGVHRLTLYPERENEHLATSSGSDYPFVLLPFSLSDVLEAFGPAASES
jgi:hypothetical protein